MPVNTILLVIAVTSKRIGKPTLVQGKGNFPTPSDFRNGSTGHFGYNDAIRPKLGIGHKNRVGLICVSCNKHAL